MLHYFGVSLGNPKVEKSKTKYSHREKYKNLHQHPTH
jgi:hypothetical protein